MKFFFKIWLSIFFSTICIALLIIIISYYNVKHSVNSNTQNDLIHKKDNATYLFNKKIDAMRYLKRSIENELYSLKDKHLELTQKLLIEKLQDKLTFAPIENRGILNIGLFDTKSKDIINLTKKTSDDVYQVEYDNSPITKSFISKLHLKQKAYISFFDPIKNKKRYIVNYQLSKISNSLLLYIEVNKEAIMAFFKKCNQLKDSYFAILDQDLKVIHHPYLNNGDSLDKHLSKEDMKKLEAIKFTKDGIIRNLFYDKKIKILLFSTLKNGWKLIYSIPNYSFSSWINAYRNQLYLLLLVSFLISILFASFLSKRITEKIEKVTTMVNHWMHNDFGKQIKNRAKNNDEIDILIDSINHTSLHVKTLLNNILENKKELQDSVEKLKLAKEENQKLAYYDSVTSLKNNNFLEKDFQNLFLKRGEEETFSFILFSITNLEEINENFTYTGGNKVLEAFTYYILEATEEKFVDIYRVSTNKFFLIFESSYDIKKIAEDVIAFENKPYQLFENRTCNIIIKAAILNSSLSNKKLESIMRRLETTLNKITTFKSSYKVFDKDDELLLQDEDTFVPKLQKALKEESIFLYYQPKISMPTHSTFGAEALARWQDEDGNFIPPDKFIYYAEKYGMIVELGEYILNKAFQQIEIWQQKCKKEFVIAINISKYQLELPSFYEDIKELIRKYNINVSCLEFEVTESSLMQNLEIGLKNLTKLHKLGIKISLDDFGTGYSSFSYMLKLPIDTIKLDKSFVQKEIFTQKGRNFLKSFIDLCHYQDFKVVAEGIETQEQLELFKKYKCDEIQGYYFSKPLSSKDFELFLNS